jgi:hypothetical protein
VSLKPEQKEEFCSWIASNLKKLPEFEPVEDDLVEVVNMFKEKFEFVKIKKSNSGTSVWNFRISCLTELSEISEEQTGYWYNRPPRVDMEIRVWKQKEKVRMGIVSTLDHVSRKIDYYNGDPRAFLEESLRRFSTNSTARKFGL